MIELPTTTCLHLAENVLLLCYTIETCLIPMGFHLVDYIYVTTYIPSTQNLVNTSTYQVRS